MAPANEAQRDAWNGEGGLRWVADADRRDRVLQPVLDALLAAAQLQPSERVLDIGCGCGATTLAAADAVAPGAVVGVDISRPMLDVATERAAGRDIPFVRADAQTDAFPGAPFDVAISRFGTMFFDDAVAAFANIRRALAPTGRLCIATWQPLGANEWVALPVTALLRDAPLPGADPGAPGMFAQSEPDAITRMFSDAGWSEVEVRPIGLEMRLGDDPVDATGYIAGIGLLRTALDEMDAGERDNRLASLQRELSQFHTDDGVKLGAGIHIVTARP